MILGENVRKSVLNYKLISDRIMIMRLKAVPVNLLIVQVYAPCEDAEDEKDSFYEMLDQDINKNRKGSECLIVTGDFNGKVGKNREEDNV